MTLAEVWCRDAAVAGSYHPPTPMTVVRQRDPKKFDPARASVLDVRDREQYLPSERLVAMLALEGRESALDNAPGTGRREIVTQHSAASRARERAGFRLVAAGLSCCVEHRAEAEADGYAIDAVQRMFMKLA